MADRSSSSDASNSERKGSAGGSADTAGKAPGLGEQFGRTRAAFLGLVRAHIDLARAENAIAAAVAEATRHGWTMGVAVVDSGANLVAFARMDGTQLAAAVIAEHKARAAAAFRRPTRAFEDAARNGAGVLSLDGAIASAGGVPLIADGKLIGAIGCSGGASAEDETTCLAGAATINGAAN